MYAKHVYTLHTPTEHLFPAEPSFYRFARHNVIKAIKSHTAHISKPYGMCNESASVKIPIINVLHEIITQSESSGSGTTGNQLLSSLFPLNAWMILRRSFALGLRDETGQEVAVICTIKSSCFSSKLGLGNVLGRYPKLEPGFYDRKQPLEDTPTAGLTELYMS